MILSIPPMLPRPDKIHVVRDNETETWRSDFTERCVGTPQLLLVEQQIPASAILPHYHCIDQFQIFMDGSGKLGNHPIEPIAIHYTNAHTGYGPIVAGEAGMSYYVVRPSFDIEGSQYIHVPAARARLRPGGKRYLLAEHVHTRTLADLRALDSTTVERVLDVPQDDSDAGVFADIVCMGPGQRHEGPAPELGGGQVHIVLQGTVVHADTVLGTRGAVAVTPDEPSVTVTSGPDGAQLMVLQYPKRLG
ncbi:MAG: hypothetical protein GEV05_07155 [Betaproteobacteria bacterium]|nr:hypothetical protein [Betaproteobacteria bacterium]